MLQVLIYVPLFLFDPEEEGGSGSKRLKGLGIGSPDGPVSLDDVRRLEKSNAVSWLLQLTIVFCPNNLLTLLA
jgi:hypothetical protein